MCLISSTSVQRGRRAAGVGRSILAPPSVYHDNPREGLAVLFDYRSLAPARVIDRIHTQCLTPCDQTAGLERRGYRRNHPRRNL